jgi:hypothetical protein
MLPDDMACNPRNAYAAQVPHNPPFAANMKIQGFQ